MVLQSEGISLAKSASLPLEDLLAIIDQGAMACPMFKLKVRSSRREGKQGGGMVLSLAGCRSPARSKLSRGMFLVDRG